MGQIIQTLAPVSRALIRRCLICVQMCRIRVRSVGNGLGLANIRHDRQALADWGPFLAAWSGPAPPALSALVAAFLHIVEIGTVHDFHPLLVPVAPCSVPPPLCWSDIVDDLRLRGRGGAGELSGWSGIKIGTHDTNGTPSHRCVLNPHNTGNVNFVES
ncbi:hypothetical protein N656DRAFT_773266 [Canariomyces notabilis]|uniref:Uncharacterized protein n=1 Tax=Canariomyces notabilis TaxID=2074819 RepID=A0AAN6TMG4_9PEZI|nr:hypothetical protein N656DRAFT_773266 [Canariomyces arenarius]